MHKKPNKKSAGESDSSQNMDDDNKMDPLDLSDLGGDENLLSLEFQEFKYIGGKGKDKEPFMCECPDCHKQFDAKEYRLKE